MRHSLNKYLFLIATAFLFFSGEAFAQKLKTIHIDQAKTGSMETIGGKRVRKLVGDVIFRQDNVKMYCDSAYQYIGQNYIEAFSNVKLVQGDTFTLTGEYLEYNGNNRQALIKKQVVLKDDEMKLETEILNYHVEKGTGFYTVGGKITSKDNVLTSQKGYYFSKTKDLYFRDNVVLNNPDYKMFSDTLRYHPNSGTAYFFGPTRIISDSTVIYCENGWYNTNTEKSRFGKNAWLRMEGQTLYGDTLYFDRKKSYGKAINNIRIIDTAEKLTIYGHFAEHFGKKKITYVTNRALLEKREEKDTFYIHADTLMAGYDSTGEHRMLYAYPKASSFSRDFQSRCDSLVYSLKDSTLSFFHEPVLWLEKYQVTGDFIKIFTKNNRFDRMEVLDRSMIINPYDSQRFNQLKGKNMTFHFLDNEIRKINVEGNGESIYYVLDDSEKILGVSKIVASDVFIRFRNKKIFSLNYSGKPDMVTYPPEMKGPDELLLEGFNWREKERPKKVDDLFQL